MTKLYPFSIRKHEHDLMYFKNWCFNNMDNSKYTPEKQAHISRCFNTVSYLLEVLMDNMDRNTGVSYLTGADYGIAKKIINWSENRRNCINF